MLKSKFSKRSSSFKANKIFTDRIEPRKVFFDSIGTFPRNPQEILVFYGKGGIGKSSLLRNLYQNMQESADDKEIRLHRIFVSLDAYDFANPINILLAIRNNIHGDCGLFDYAMMQYCSKARMSVEEIMQKNTALSVQVMEVLNDIVAIGTLSACVPTATLRKCVSFIKDMRFKKRYKEEIEEIGTLNEFEIFRRLPYYLGLCIAYAAEKGDYHAIFFDSYESYLIRIRNDTPSEDREEWLKELFLSSEYLRIIIASRDRLRWDYDDPEWGDYIDQHLLSNLSDEDSRWFLEQIPIRDDGIIETIVKNAGGVPLYLDMCVDIYEDDVNSNRPFSLSSAGNGEKLIGRYLRHLTQQEKYAVKILAALRGFDLTFASELLKKQQVILDASGLRELMQRSIFLKIDETRELWKVDESVRLHQRSRIDHGKAAEILQSILECLNEHPKGEYYKHLALVLETACDWPEVMPTIILPCIQAIDYYANVGFWKELHLQLNAYIGSENEYLNAIAVLAELICLRRTGELNRADELYRQYPLSKETIGIWYYMYAYIGIQIRHLLGRYDESITAYKELIREMDLVRPLIPDHIYLLPCIKYADLLFLKGKFDESLQIVHTLIANNKLSTPELIEFLRIKGHIYRFRGQYGEAETIYRSALEIAQKDRLRAFLGKLYTNMTETLCVNQSEQALEWFEKAKDENNAAYNEIELGKAYAAASVAYTVLGQYETAIMLAKQSVAYAEKTGYKSGQAFGLIALYYAYLKSGKTQKAQETKRRMQVIFEMIGVYEYLWERVNHD